MKHLLVLFTLWSVSAQAHAQGNTCSSVWVYKPYLTCAQGAGPNLAAGGVFVAYQELPSAWIRGGADDQAALCAEVVNHYNEDQLTRNAGFNAVLTQATPVREDDKKRIDGTYYKYFCGVNISRYPVNTAAPAAQCGTELKWKAQSPAQGMPANAEVRCMTCDHLDTSPDMNQLVNCMYANIAEVIEAKDTYFGNADLAPFKAKIQTLMQIHQSSPIESLNQFNVRSAFEKYKN